MVCHMARGRKGQRLPERKLKWQALFTQACGGMLMAHHQDALAPWSSSIQVRTQESERPCSSVKTFPRPVTTVDYLLTACADI